MDVKEKSRSATTRIRISEVGGKNFKNTRTREILDQITKSIDSIILNRLEEYPIERLTSRGERIEIRIFDTESLPEQNSRPSWCEKEIPFANDRRNIGVHKNNFC